MIHKFRIPIFLRNQTLIMTEKWQHVPFDINKWFHLINIFTGSLGWNRQHHSQTIHPTEKLISMNLCIILWVVTWAWLFLTPMVMEAVRGQKRYSERTLWYFNSIFDSSHSAISAYQKRSRCSPVNEISNSFQCAIMHENIHKRRKCPYCHSFPSREYCIVIAVRSVHGLEALFLASPSYILCSS